MSAGSTGIVYAVAAYGLWGFAPIYWKALRQVPSGELLAHRILWSLLVGLLLLAATRTLPELFSALRSRRQALPVGLAAALLACNWLTFIWAVNHDQILATSLGYYITPLLSVVLGVIVLSERLRPWQLVAFGLAVLGVVLLVVERGELPWIALVLALSFGLYGLVRKMAPVAPRVGFAVEGMVLSPLALVYVLSLVADGEHTVPLDGVAGNLLIAGSGVITAAPLLLFNAAAKRLPLATLGFFQYLAPSLAFLLAVGLYDEPFERVDAVTFGCVWAALAIFSLDSLRARRGVG